MRTSLIITVYNEEKTIALLLKSVLQQTESPGEVIIVDALSKDMTIVQVEAFRSEFAKKRIQLTVIRKKGNRSVGRNVAISNAKAEIILCTDAGCILEKNWVKNIVAPFQNSDVDVVAGYYKGKGTSAFQQSLIPYVLIMEDRVDEKSFLPSSRSMAIRKRLWKKIGGFSEQYSHNEDYVFARGMRRVNAKIIFQKKAMVYWLPRTDLVSAFIMFFRFALGDAEAKLFRPKVLLIFIRYLCGAILAYYLIETHRTGYIFIIVLIYFLWAIEKSYKYVRRRGAILYLPVLQIISDLAVILGTIFGVVKVVL